MLRERITSLVGEASKIALRQTAESGEVEVEVEVEDDKR